MSHPPEKQTPQTQPIPETRASFIPPPSAIKPQTSPLLSSTPPIISKSLIKSYPYLLIINKCLSVLTWTDDDIWSCILVVSIASLLIVYFEIVLIYVGHLVIVGVIYAYSILNTSIKKKRETNPTLDDIVFLLNSVTTKVDILITPITKLSLNSYDLKRLLFTTIFLSPIYIIITYFLISPRILVLTLTVFLLTYHSSWSIVTRRILWKFKLVRLVFFYLTGLNFINSQNSTFLKNGLLKFTDSKKFGDLKNYDGKPIRFTYVLYENQRRWLGIGWTSNLLSYERTPWTDEFLNESLSIAKFQLPKFDTEGMYWKWVDKTWRLDLTNDGSIVSNKKTKTIANPNVDDGFIYFDNTWKKPSSEDSYSKYTRRRRWIRTAELIPINDKTPASPTSPTGVDEKKKLRFDDEKIDKSEVETEEKKEIVSDEESVSSESSK